METGRGGFSETGPDRTQIAMETLRPACKGRFRRNRPYFSNTLLACHDSRSDVRRQRRRREPKPSLGGSTWR